MRPKGAFSLQVEAVPHNDAWLKSVTAWISYLTEKDVASSCKVWSNLKETFKAFPGPQDNSPDIHVDLDGTTYVLKEERGRGASRGLAQPQQRHSSRAAARTSGGMSRERLGRHSLDIFLQKDTGCTR